MASPVVMYRDMPPQPKILVHDRHCFRPDLRDCELEDRPLMAGPISPFPTPLNGNVLFSVFNYLGAAGPGGNPFSGGGGGGPGPTVGLGTSLFSIVNAGVGTQFGSFLNTIGSGVNAAGASVLAAAAASANSNSPLASMGPLLEFSASSGAAMGNGAHNNGPIGSAGQAGALSGYGTSFSSGGNFASTFSGTYNGFANALEIAPSITENSRARMGMPPQTPGTTTGTPGFGSDTGQNANPYRASDTSDENGNGLYSPYRLTRTSGIYSSLPAPTTTRRSTNP